MSARVPRGHWLDIENCAKAALKHQTRSSFKRYFGGAYSVCRRNNWLDIVCAHMYPAQGFSGVLQEKCVYVLKSEESVYVGITTDINRRELEHRASKTLPEGFDCILKHAYMPAYLAANIEKDEINKYRNDTRYHCVNKSDGGTLGGGVKIWTKLACARQALKYSRRSDFNSGSRAAYSACVKNNWLDDVCGHMSFKAWTRKRCFAEALKYSTRTVFRKNSGGAYFACLRNDWLDDACCHMVSKKGIWNIKRNCISEAEKYSTKSEFWRHSNGAYSACRKNGWLDQVWTASRP